VRARHPLAGGGGNDGWPSKRGNQTWGREEEKITTSRRDSNEAGEKNWRRDSARERFGDDGLECRHSLNTLSETPKGGKDVGCSGDDRRH